MSPGWPTSKSHDNYITICNESETSPQTCKGHKQKHVFSLDANHAERGVLVSVLSLPKPPPMLRSTWPAVTTDKVHVLLVPRRNENLQTGETLPHTCLICVFNDLLVLTAKEDSSLGRNPKSSDKSTTAGKNVPDFECLVALGI